MNTIKVLFVCLGNICRSPLGMAIFKEKIRQKGMDNLVEADSCGTSNYNVGNRPDARTLANAKRNGIAVEHCARQLQPGDLANFDYILTMDNNNRREVLRLVNAQEHAHKIFMIRDFDPQGKGEVPDPYFGGEQGFQEVYDILDRTIESFIDHLKVTHFEKITAG